MVGGTQGLKSRNKGNSSSNAESPSKNIKSKPKINRKTKRCSLKLVTVSSVFFLGLVMLLHHFYFKSSSSDSRDSLRRLITPAPLPKLTDLPMFQGEHRESLYWGSYRSHLYFGVRARTPKSLMLGLMWLGVKDGRYALRHTCEMSDGLNSYSWIRHDGRNFGQQVIEDQGFSIETMFLKRRSSSSGYGGDWAVRIEVHNDRFSEEESLKDGHIFFYIADEAGHPLKLGKGVSKLISNKAVVSGHREDVRGWEVHCQGMDDLQIHYAGYNTLHFHNMTDVVQQTLAIEVMKTRSLQLPDIVEDNSNIMIFQVSRKIPFKLDLVFVSGISSENDLVNERVQTLSGTSLTNLIKEHEDNFERHFEVTFGLTEKVDKEIANVGKAALSSLIGGIGYFYGQSRIAIPKEYKDVIDRDYALYWPAPLYTAVPSRSFFPRGFLWDEGFHQLLIWRWDISICLDIIGHWLDLMNLDGWIPREQILGTEALRKVPEEFVIQNPTNANPPTLFLALHDLASEVTKNSWTAMEKETIKSFLQRAFPRLDMWFHWFNTTQAGKVATSFYWHGRDNITNSELNPKTLQSGLDDYPRASHPSDDERHLDLRCWMALAADCMYQISKEVSSVNHEYWKTALQLKDLNILNQMHFDNFSGMYHDFGSHTEKASLKWIELHDTKSYSIRRELRRVVGDVPVLRFVPHFGYVSLFPLIMKIIPSESPVLKTQLDLISNRSLLWTNFGLRSLARTSSLYMKRNTEHDPPYWRGPVWININYLVLSALNHYAKEDGPYSSTALDVYSRLRHNVIRNIADNYNKTGYFWEQYDNAASGKGKGAHPFTGWTSLIVLIMAEKY